MNRRIPFPAPSAALGLFTLLLAAAPAPPARAADAPLTEKIDPRSGEKVLRELLGTDDLGPVRLRAAEIGARERRAERARSAPLARAGAGPLAEPVWTSIGPAFRPNPGRTEENAYDTSGLVADIETHPTDPNTIWVATAGGGIWKTTNKGGSWRPLTDDLGALPIGGLSVAESDPRRVYAGTGCGDTSSTPTQNAPGFGVILSTDGGETWRVSPAGSAVGTKFYELDANPTNPLDVLAAGDRGVQRSTDGGETWSVVLAPEPDILAVSLSRSRVAPNVVYAGTVRFSPFVPGSVWKSVDSGATWTEKANGLPGTSATRSRPEVAVAPSDPNRVYVLFANTTGAGEQLDMIRSTNGGDVWTALNLGSKTATNTGEVVNVLGSQGVVMTTVGVDPQNPDVLYAGGLDRWKSMDAGNGWARISNWRGPRDTAYLHADQHALAFGADGTAYFGTDGGIFSSTDGGTTFRSLNRGLVTLQFYFLCQSPASPDLVMGGQQDNGTSLRVSGTDWREPGIGGDGFGCLIHPSNPMILHGSAQNGAIVRSTNGGASFRDATTGCNDCSSSGSGGPGSRFATFLERHPIQADTIYTPVARRVYRSTNNGSNWTATSAEIAGITFIRDFAILPTDGSRLLIAANAGQVLESLDDGATWAKIGQLPAGIDTLNAARYDRTDVRRLFVVSGRSNAGTERFWVSNDSGATWTSRSRTGQPGGLPDVPLLTMEQDVRDPNVLWVASYVGLYRSGDLGQTWARYGLGLPNAIVTDIGLMPDGSKLRIATFGRGIWEIPNVVPTPNQQPTVQIVAPAAAVAVEAGVDVSFSGSGTDPDPGDTLTYSWSFGDGTPPATGPTPPAHPFAQPGSYTVTLTVSDGKGGSATATRAVTVTASTLTGLSKLLPVVLETPGAGGSFYTSEVTLASRAAGPVEVLLAYTASVGGGSGVARLTLAPGEQRVVGGMIGYLRSRSLAIPSDPPTNVGTLGVTFGGVSDPNLVFAGARTFTPDPDPAGAPGTFGLFDVAADTTAQSATVVGLQQNDAQRSNLAVVNAGPSPISLSVALVGPSGQDLGSLAADLPAWGWKQFNTPLSGRGAAHGAAIVTRTAGSAPFTAYGVLNDAKTSDGSFIVPLLPGDGSGGTRLVPIVLRAAGYRSELTLTNRTGSPLSLTLVYTGSPQLNTAGSGTASLTLSAFEQRVEPDAMAFLASLGLAIPSSGNVGGSLLLRVPGGVSAEGFAAGARTFTPRADGGTFGLFYPALTLGESASTAAWVYGLQQNGAQRSNLAVVNRGDAGDAITLRVTYYSPEGAVLPNAETRVLGPGEWAQFNTPLASRGAESGYARIERLSGASRFVAYGVLNDQVNSDGSFIPMQK